MTPDEVLSMFAYGGATGLSGIVAYLFVGGLSKVIPNFPSLMRVAEFFNGKLSIGVSLQKRLASIAASMILACAAYLLLVGFGYESNPGDGLAWFQQIFEVATKAFGLSQLIHGVLDLNKK